MNKLPKTLLQATKNTNTIAECIVSIPKTIPDKYVAFRNLFIYQITDKLIEVTGRFCEYYASDLLVTLDTIRAAMLEDDDGIYYIGIRKNGVDHNSYVFINMQQKIYASDYYRALYAVEFHRDAEFEMYNERRIKVCLKDMSSLRYCEEDNNFEVNDIDKTISENTTIIELK